MRSFRLQLLLISQAKQQLTVFDSLHLYRHLSPATAIKTKQNTVRTSTLFVLSVFFVLMMYSHDIAFEA